MAGWDAEMRIWNRWLIDNRSEDWRNLCEGKQHSYSKIFLETKPQTKKKQANKTKQKQNRTRALSRKRWATFQPGAFHRVHSV